MNRVESEKNTGGPTRTARGTKGDAVKVSVLLENSVGVHTLHLLEHPWGCVENSPYLATDPPPRFGAAFTAKKRRAPTTGMHKNDMHQGDSMLS